ncbi:hypothetical protein MRB53_016509 [Persea americana]|uniref:Uncharacterized protein n=1 Tax=Persea americana TaxID=3435 RepID=A0ACC2M2F0_PERAE|nr:hypothetical protein MRB53_016509 [Persea americana]
MATHLPSWQSIAGEMEDVLARTWLESFQISTDIDGQKSILEKDWMWWRYAKEETRRSIFSSFSGLAVERDLRKRRRRLASSLHSKCPGCGEGKLRKRKR